MTKGQGTALVVWTYIATLLLLIFVGCSYVGLFSSHAIEKVVNHHHCIVWQSGFGQSISCDWSKP